MRLGFVCQRVATLGTVTIRSNGQLREGAEMGEGGLEWKAFGVMSAEEALKFYAVNECEIADDNDALAPSCTE